MTKAMDDDQKTGLGSPRVKRVWPHKLWLNMIRARRTARRAQKELRHAVADHAAEVKDLTERYEEYLELERARYSSMVTELTSRIVQAVGQQPILTTDLPGLVTDPKYRPKQTDGDITDILSSDAIDRLDEEYERFVDEGEQMGLSPAAIRERWKQVRPAVIEDMM